jgi:hypothetical protein
MSIINGTARVQVTIEIPSNDVWDDECSIGQLHK